jgi:MDMPI C-terminal domain
MPEFEPIWDRWNAMTPAMQSAEGLVADRTFLDQLLGLDDQQRQSWQLDMFGEVRDLTGLLRLRLGELAVHTWDVAVTRDPTATVAPDAAALLIDTLDQLVARTGRAPQDPVRVSVATEGPDRRFLLISDGDGVQLHPVDDLPGDDGTSTLELPAEALIRLVYGRLDPDHTPAGAHDQGTLDLLRRTFPGP